MRLLNTCSILVLLPLTLAVTHGQDSVSSNTGLPAGVSLPRTGMVYALDPANPALVLLHASEISSNSHIGGNLARGLVYAGPRATVELNGLTASVHLSGRLPSLYVHINSEDPDLMRRQIHLIHLPQTKENRVVVTHGQNVFGGHRSKHYDDIAVAKVDVEPDVWVRVTPSAPLDPGEYGIVFMPADVNLSPSLVYDFDVAMDDAKPAR